MDKQKLEQQKIMLTKEYEKVKEQIDYYWLEKIAFDSWPFKDLINKRDSIKFQIQEIKKILDNN